MKEKATVHIFNVAFEAEFEITLKSDGSAVFELKEPIHLPPKTFKIFYGTTR